MKLFSAFALILAMCLVSGIILQVAWKGWLGLRLFPFMRTLLQLDSQGNAQPSLEETTQPRAQSGPPLAPSGLTADSGADGDDWKAMLRAEKEWLIQCQLPNGAIRQTPDNDSVIPYFANLAAKTLVDLDPARSRRYIQWYLANLNQPDRWGLEGTIYDYRVKGKELVPTHDYDSADSYAATFLSLVAYYHAKTGDDGFIEDNMALIDKVAGVICKLQDRDGLVYVKPKVAKKYLMDNAENFRGMNDWADTLDKLGYQEKAQKYREVAARIADGIQGVLYDPRKDAYAWSYSSWIKLFPVGGRWYPDGVSQLYLISNGVLKPEDPRAVKIWLDFNSQFPGWEQGVKNDEFPWGNIALTAQMMDDSQRAGRFLQWAVQHFVGRGRPYPWYVLESSSLIQLHGLLGDDASLEASPPSLAGR